MEFCHNFYRFYFYIDGFYIIASLRFRTLNFRGKLVFSSFNCFFFLSFIPCYKMNSAVSVLRCNKFDDMRCSLSIWVLSFVSLLALVKAHQAVNYHQIANHHQLNSWRNYKVSVPFSTYIFFLLFYFYATEKSWQSLQQCGGLTSISNLACEEERN